MQSKLSDWRSMQCAVYILGIVLMQFSVPRTRTRSSHLMLCSSWNCSISNTTILTLCRMQNAMCNYANKSERKRIHGGGVLRSIYSLQRIITIHNLTHNCSLTLGKNSWFVGAAHIATESFKYPTGLAKTVRILLFIIFRRFVLLLVKFLVLVCNGSHYFLCGVSRVEFHIQRSEKAFRLLNKSYASWSNFGGFALLNFYFFVCFFFFSFVFFRSLFIEYTKLSPKTHYILI